MKNIKRYIKRALYAYARNVNEFYKPLVDAGVPTII